MSRFVLALAVLALASCAVTSTEFSRAGPYVGATVIGAVSNFDDLEDGDPDSGDFSAGFGVRAGYRFLDRFAIEGAYDGAMHFEGDEHDVDLDTLALQAKFYPFTGAIQPYALGGVGYGNADSGDEAADGDGMIYRLGLGLEMYVLDILPIILEFDYTLPSGDIRDLEYFAAHLGALFRF